MYSVHRSFNNFKSQFKKADKSGAAFAIIIGEEEALQGQVALKPLRIEAEQSTVNFEQLLATLQQYLNNDNL